jgi:hypothetical protein
MSEPIPVTNDPKAASTSTSGSDELIASPSDTKGTSPIEQPAEPALHLTSGEAFSIEDVNDLLCERPVTVVTLVGDVQSGKSTLICSIYDRFLHTTFADRMSCGIRTIIGLERRAHYERLDSGRNTPDTARTPLSLGLQYFHFPVASVMEPHQRVDVVISDRAGELYSRARGNPHLVTELGEFERADVVCILMDGGRAAELEERASAMQAVRQTLQLLTDTKAVDQTSVVQVVTTKQDLLQTAPDWATFQSKLEGFRRSLTETFGSRVKALEFYSVAARDPKGTLPRASGVDNLFESWLGRYRNRSLTSIVPKTPLTEFDKLAGRDQSGEQQDA